MCICISPNIDSSIYSFLNVTLTVTFRLKKFRLYDKGFSIPLSMYLHDHI